MTGAGAEALPVGEHSVTLDFGNGSDWPSRRLTCNAPADIAHLHQIAWPLTVEHVAGRAR